MPSKLTGSLDFLFVLEAPSKIQNGGTIQDGRQTIKCSRFFKNDANNLHHRLFKKYNKTNFVFQTTKNG
jgi:hypothetical protein